MNTNVVCLKWGSKYPSEYVNRLYSMVKRTLTIKHRFVCLTEDPAGVASGIEVKPIEESELTGWWHKLTLFKRRIYDLEGPTLFLDLDVVIIGHLDRFFEHVGSFCIIDDWNVRRTPTTAPSSGSTSALTLTCGRNSIKTAKKS